MVSDVKMCLQQRSRSIISKTIFVFLGREQESAVDGGSRSPRASQSSGSSDTQVTQCQDASLLDTSVSVLETSSDMRDLTVTRNSCAVDSGCQYDVGNFLTGEVNRDSLSNCEKSKYLSEHFKPDKNYQSYVKQTLIRGKTKQKKVLTFQTSWLENYGWLVYSPAVGGGLCKYCVMFSSNKDSRKYAGALVTKPFTNLVKATGKDGVLEAHSSLQYHKDSAQMGLLMVQHHKSPKKSLPYLISQKNQELYDRNISILKSIIEAVVLCGKQNFALRGHRDDSTSDASNKGNFLAILDVMAKRDPMLNEHLKTADRNAQYTSKTVQNEVIDLIAQYIRNEKTKALKQGDSFFAIIADEVTDPHANQEVLSVCLRLVEGTE